MQKVFFRLMNVATIAYSLILLAMAPRALKNPAPEMFGVLIGYLAIAAINYIASGKAVIWHSKSSMS